MERATAEDIGILNGWTRSDTDSGWTTSSPLCDAVVGDASTCMKMCLYVQKCKGQTSLLCTSALRLSLAGIGGLLYNG